MFIKNFLRTTVRVEQTFTELVQEVYPVLITGTILFVAQAAFAASRKAFATSQMPFATSQKSFATLQTPFEL